MQKYELVISEYDSLNDCDVDKVVKLNGIENMNELTVIDNYISKYSKRKRKRTIRKRTISAIFNESTKSGYETNGK